MLRRTFVALLGLGLGLAFAPPASARCANFPIVPLVLTPKDTAITGGGVLVGLGFSNKQATDLKPAVAQPTWRFRHGAKLSTPTITTLAPGLAVYRVPDENGSLVDDKQRVLVNVRRGAQPLEIAAPKLVKAVATGGGLVDAPRPRRGPTTTLKIELGSAPRGAVAAILFHDGTAVHWTTTVEGGMGEMAFYAGGHCGDELPGTSVPTSGTISVAWVDGAGRLSPRSNTIAITR